MGRIRFFKLFKDETRTKSEPLKLLGQNGDQKISPKLFKDYSPIELGSLNFLEVKQGPNQDLLNYEGRINDRKGILGISKDKTWTK